MFDIRGIGDVREIRDSSDNSVDSDYASVS